MISGQRVVFSHQTRPALPLTSSEKSIGDAEKIAFHLDKKYFVIKMYISVVSHLNESHINHKKSVRDLL